MSTAKLYEPLQTLRPRIRKMYSGLQPRVAARFARVTSGDRPPQTASPPAFDMRFPLATSIRIVRHDSRRLIVAAQPNLSLLALALLFFGAAYGLAAWAIVGGALRLPVEHTFMLTITLIVLLHVAFRYLLGPVGAEQTFDFDKTENRLTVTTKGVWRDHLAHYRLNELVKIHLNRVDDGTYDPHTMLAIFKGGGTLQFPAHSGSGPQIEALTRLVTAFTRAPRSDEADGASVAGGQLEIELAPSRQPTGTTPSLDPAFAADDLDLDSWRDMTRPHEFIRHQ